MEMLISNASSIRISSADKARLNAKVMANEKLSKADFIAYMAMLAHDFYDGHRESEGDLEAKSVLACFNDFGIEAIIDAID